MILIADGGSTSCDWIVLNKFGEKELCRFKSKGLNPTYSSQIILSEILNETKELVQYKRKIKEIYFFGSGCNSIPTSEKLETVFSIFFTALKIQNIQGDIQGAVYACTSKPAVVGILGTGSNICYFDGSEIHTKIESLGYSIMDDGAGSALGRLLLRAFYYKQLPLSISQKLTEKYNLNPNYLKDNIYNKPFSGRFLASYASFVFEHLDEPILENMLFLNLDNYFKYHVLQYQDELKKYPLHLVGSIAHLSQLQIIKLCEKYEIELGKIVKTPIDSLAQNFKNFI